MHSRVNNFTINEERGKQILKKIIILFSLILVSSFSFQVVKAEASDYDLAVQIADEANLEIIELIEAAQLKAEKLPQIQDLIIAKLIEDTFDITNDAINEIEALGFEADCYYVTVLIGDQLVEIDPIRVHTW